MNEGVYILNSADDVHTVLVYNMHVKAERLSTAGWEDLMLSYGRKLICGKC